MMTNREFKDFAKMAVAVAALLLLILIGNLFGFHEDRQSVHIRWALGSATLFVLLIVFSDERLVLAGGALLTLAVLGVVNLIIHPTLVGLAAAIPCGGIGWLLLVLAAKSRRRPNLPLDRART